MPTPLIVVGAGGFGRETLDVIDAVNTVDTVWELAGVVDDNPSPHNLDRLARRGAAYLGAIEVALAWPEPTAYVVGIGKPSVRRLLATRLDAAGFSAATLVHPAATFGFDVRLGAGSIVCAGVRLTTSVTIGRHAHLNPNVTVGHDSTLGDFVSLNPGANVAGDNVVGDAVLIAVGALVAPQVRIGDEATLLPGARALADVAPGGVVS